METTPPLELFAPQKQQQQKQGSCALLFFGLPRSYETVVLPSIVKNVLEPNNHCDVYAHAIVREEEEAGRSGKGGTIDPNALYLLQQKVNNDNHVAIATDTEDDFWKLHNATLTKYRNTKAKNGELLYYPWKLRDIKPSSVENIIKQWHSIESVWNLMERESLKIHKKYNRVGMFRSDVFFVTPIDIHKSSSPKEAVTPGFALYPINDRMIYGPYDAVKLWATGRFQRFEDNIHKIPAGHGMHSEVFLDTLVFPAIRQQDTTIREDPGICFFRVRADESMWVNDCLRARTRRGGTLRNPKWVSQKKKAVEKLLGRTCKIQPLTRLINQLLCPTKAK